MTTFSSIGYWMSLTAVLAVGSAKDDGGKSATGKQPDVRSPETPQESEAERLSAEGERHLNSKEWDQARAAFAAVLQIVERIHGKDHWKTGDARRDLAGVSLLERLSTDDRARLQATKDRAREVEDHSGQGRFMEAIAMQQDVLETCRKLLGESHPRYAENLNILASLHYLKADYAKAEPLFRLVLEVRRKALGEAHPDFARSLNNLAATHIAKREFAKAESHLYQALEIQRRVLGDAHPDVALSLNGLAELHNSQGDYAKTEVLLHQVVEIKRTALGEGHRDFAEALDSLARFFVSQADYAKAEPLYRQIVEINRKALGEEHPDFAESLSSLATLHVRRGDYVKAESLFRKALEIKRKALGEVHPFFVGSLLNLATLYSLHGNYVKAEPLLRRCLEVQRKTLGEDHPDYAKSLNNLGELNWRQGDYANAELLFRQAVETFKKAHGEAHPDYLRSLHNLAKTHHSQGKAAKAEPLYHQVMEVRRKTLGESHPDYARSLDSLAEVHRSRGDYAKAEPLCRQSFEIRRKTLGESHPVYATSLTSLAALHLAKGEHAKADAQYREAVRIFRGFCESSSELQDEASQLAQVVLYSNAVVDRLLIDPVKTGVDASSLYGDVLSWKGLVAFRQRWARSAATALAEDKGATQMLIELQQASRRLALLARSQPDLNRRDSLSAELKQAVERRDRIEADLAHRTAAFRRLRAEKTFTPFQLQRLLPEGAVLIDFLEAGPEEARLLAFLIDSKTIARVDLGDPAPITKAVDNVRPALATSTNPLEGKDDPARVLHQRIWKPFAPHLKGAKHIIVSPDGALTRMPFAALPIAEDKYLIEEFQVSVLPVPRMLPDLLAPRETKTEAQPSLLAVGGVDFNAVPSGGTPAAVQPLVLAAASGSTTPLRRGAQGLDGQKWSALPGAAREAEAVGVLFRGSAPNGKLTTLDGPKATADAVRGEFSKQRYLHLATHGFLADPKFKSALAAKENKGGFMDSSFSRPAGLHPGLLSGLVFAGANKPSPNDDGILTALEVGDIDLSNVELAFLSACETGLGEVAGGEGVLGLQRAFQVAGARSTVTSLWKVDDLATELLVTRFYKNLWKKKLPKAEALREAQLWMLKEGRGAGVARGLELKNEKQKAPATGRLPPHFWAAFALAGDWR